MDFGREKTLISQNWMGREGWTWPWALGKVTLISNLDEPGSLDMAVGLGEGNSEKMETLIWIGVTHKS